MTRKAAPVSHTVTGGSRLSNWGPTLPSLPLPYPFPWPNTYRLRDIFAYRGWKSPTGFEIFALQTRSGGTPSNINVIYTSLKSAFSVQQFCRWQYGSIFIRLVAVVSQICEITRNSDKIRTYSSSRSSEVIDLGANRKCNFLLVIHSNFGRISYRFRDIDA